MYIPNKWTYEIDAITSHFNSSFGHLSISELNQKPNPQTWSIAQNIDHLIIINATYQTVIKQIREGRYKLPFMARFDIIVSFFEKIVLSAVEPNRKKKMKTFPVWQPSKSNIEEDIWEQFHQSQSDLKSLIHSCADLVDKKVIIASPANKHIVYKLDTAFEIIIRHEKRHLNQSIELKHCFGWL